MLVGGFEVSVQGAAEPVLHEHQRVQQERHAVPHAQDDQANGRKRRYGDRVEACDVHPLASIGR